MKCLRKLEYTVWDYKIQQKLKKCCIKEAYLTGDE